MFSLNKFHFNVTLLGVVSAHRKEVFRNAVGLFYPDVDGYKSWLALGIEKLGRDVVGEVESDWMVPLLVEDERDRLLAWQLGVSL